MSSQVFNDICGFLRASPFRLDGTDDLQPPVRRLQ